MEKEKLIPIKIEDEMKSAYIDYSMSVIVSRALPDVRDGLKPVHRRVLFGMNEMGVRSSSSYKKSARIVGDVMGKYHPHGDSSVYDTMVRMAQEWSLRYILVDGQGNFGSVDGDSPAAMRYTEARMQKISEDLLSDIDKETVDFQLNFDDTIMEPTVLPTRVPALLINGASGIAVGMATDIASHNINEVIDATIKLIDKPKTDLKDILKIINGPDFSNHASIIANSEELYEMYATGRGGFKIQAHWTQEQNQIIINALPYQASGSKILEQIADQMVNKKLPMVVDLSDEGDHKEPVRLVITLKSNRVNASDLMNHLFASTDLQKSYRMNMNLISLKGGPKVFSLVDLLKEWLVFRKETVKRKLEHRLDQVNDRLHILEGLLTIFIDIDKVIKIIRNSEEPKKDLIKNFKLSDIQANAILEIKLRQIAKLEQIKLEKEKNELVSEQDEIEKVLKSKSRLKTLIKNELLEIKDNFGDERKSPIISESEAKVFSEEETIVTEPITVVLSKAGWIRSAKGHEIDPSSLSYKGDDSLQDFARGKSNQLAVFLDSNGKAYSIPSHSLPSARGMGEPITGRLNADSGVKFISSSIGADVDKFLIMNSGGYGYIAEYKNMISNKKSGRAFMRLPENAEMLKAIPLRNDHTHIAAVSNIGKLLIFEISELPILGKGKGNKIINIPKDKLAAGEEFMAHAQLLAIDSSLRIEVGKRFVTLKPKDWSEYILTRAKRGKKVGKLINIERLVEELKTAKEDH